MHGPPTPALDSPPLARYGLPELVYGTSPAAGTDFSVALDGNFFVRLVAVYCKFVADANAASREVVVSYENQAGDRFALAGINTTVTANNTAYYAFSAFQPEAVATVDSSALVPLAPILLAPTQVWKLHVVNVQAGDQLSQIRWVRERFYTTSQPTPNVPQPG